MKIFIRTALLVLFGSSAFAQTTGDYRSAGSGNWNALASWERFNGATWITPTAGQGTPTSASGVITIQNTHTITATAAVTVDQTVINAGGVVTVVVSSSLTVVDGAGTDMVIAGTLINNGNYFTSAGSTSVLSGGKLQRGPGTGLSSSTATLSFLAGSVYEHSDISAGTSLPSAIYNAASTVLIDGFSYNPSNFNSSWNVPLGNVIYDCPAQTVGIDFGGFLRNIQGNLDIKNTGSGRIFFNNGGTNTLASLSAINIGGHFGISGGSNVSITSGGTVEVYVAGDFTMATTSGQGQGANTGTATIQVGGNANLTAGTWVSAFGTGGKGIFNFKGNVATAGAVLTELGSSAQGTLNFIGTSAQTFQASGVPSTIMNLTVNNAAGVTLTSDLTLGGTLTLTTGKLTLQNSTLTLNAVVAQTSGSIGTSGNASLVIEGAGALPSALTIAPGSSFVGFQLNRVSSTLTTSSSFTITGNLDLFAGTFTNNGTVTMGNGSTVTRKATSASSIGVLSHALTAAGSYDLIYQTTVGTNTGPELSASTTAVRNFTKQGAGSLGFNSNCTINGNLDVQAGALSDAGLARTLNLKGNLTTNGSVSLGSSTFNFIANTVASTVSGSTAPIFGTLNFSNSVNIGESFQILSNINVSSGSTVTATAGTATIGITTITNAGTLNLAGISIATGKKLVAPVTTLGVSGDFNVNGVFTHNNGTVLFNGNSSILGTSALTFRNISVTGTVTSALNITLNANLVNNGGTINFTAGTFTFAGGAPTITGTPVATNFFNVTLNSGVLLTSSSPFSVAGVLTIPATGSLTANTGANISLSGNLVGNGPFVSSALVTFAGTTIVSGTAAKTFKDILLTGVATTNAAYSVSGNINATGTGTLLAGSSSGVTFNGTSVLTSSSSQIMAFNNVTITAGSSVTANCNIAVNGLTLNFGTGSFTSTALTTLGGAGTVTMTGTGSIIYKNIIIKGGTTFAPGANYTVNGDLQVTGSLSSGTSVVTFGGVTNLTASATPSVSFNSIVIASLSSLKSITGAINVTGNFTDNGTFDANNGTVSFAGNGVTKVVSGSSVTPFYNLSVGHIGAAGITDVQLTTSKDLFGVLTLATNASFDPDASGAKFTLRSTSDGPSASFPASVDLTASIAALPSPGNTSPLQIDGTITAQRYMTGEGRIYRYISTPLQGVLLHDWSSSFPISGTFSDHAPYSVICGKPVSQGTATLFYYNEPTKAYVPYPNGGSSFTNPLYVGTGYAAFIRQCSVPTLINVTGTLANGINMGNVDMALSHTAPVTDYNNLVGNPYPSAVDWDNVTSANVGTTIAVRDNSTGVFQYYTRGGGGATDIPNGVIAQAQAFWTFTTGTGAVIHFKETSKAASSASTGNIFYRTTTAAPQLLTISVSGSTQAQSDKAIVLQSPGASGGVGLDSIDAPKMNNQIDDPYTELFDLYTAVGSKGKPLAVNALPVINCSTQIQLSLKDAKAGTYTFSFARTGALSSLKMNLVDRFLKKTADISTGSYSFTVTTDTASKSLTRFKITFAEEALSFDLPVTPNISLCGTNPATVILSNPQPGVSYYAMILNKIVSDTIPASGTSIQFVIPNVQFADGVNTVVIMAIGICDAYPLNNHSTVQKATTPSLSSISVTRCSPGSVVLKFNGKAGTNYTWYEGMTDTKPLYLGREFTTPQLSSSRNYYVSAIEGAGGCESARVQVVATIVNAPVASINVLNETTLQSNATAGNRWSFNGEILADTTASLKVKSSGIYTLTVNTNGCVSKDERMMSVESLGEGKGINAYPNPVAGTFFVEVPDPENRLSSLPVFNTMGGQIGTVYLNNQGVVKKGQFDFTQFASGFYYIKVVSGPTPTILKVIKN